MTVEEFYFTIEKPAVAEFKDRGSRFIGYAFPLQTKEAFKKQLVAVKADHPKGSHYCFAYRMGLEGNDFRTSDDGEPSGTAGKPILGQIDSKELTNTLIVAVRYFGGSLLGIPGLINAYKTTASLVLQLTPILQKQVEVNYTLAFDYTMMNEMMVLIKQYNCTVLRQEAQLFCSMHVGIPVNRVQAVLNRLNDMRNVEIKLTP